MCRMPSPRGHDVGALSLGECVPGGEAAPGGVIRWRIEECKSSS